MGLKESWIVGGRLGISLGEVATELGDCIFPVVKRFRWQAALAHSFSPTSIEATPFVRRLFD